MQEANGNNLLIGRGKAFFDRFDQSGNSTGFRFLGEAAKVDTTPSVTNKEYYTSTKASNIKIANVNIQQKHTISVELMEFTRENVALALLGDGVLVTQAMTTVTNEVIAGGVNQAAPAIGRSYQTSKGNISAVTLTSVAADGTTSTPLVVNVDYEIEDAGTGLITLLSATAAPGTPGVTVKATTYTSGAVNGAKVTAGTSVNIKGAFLFIGDPASGPKMNLRVWKTEITPSAAFSLIADDFGSMTLDAEVLDDSANHPTSPLYEVFYPTPV